jgi:hypothetical protein
MVVGQMGLGKITHLLGEGGREEHVLDVALLLFYGNLLGDV